MIRTITKGDSIELDVHVIPRSSNSEIVGEYDGALRIKVNSPPVNNAANEEMIKLISKYFCIAKSSVSVVSGHVSRNKKLRISGGEIRKIQDILQSKS